MPQVLSCPNAGQLRQFALGDLAEAELARLEQHLARCPHCLQTMHGLHADDPLCADLRKGSATPRPKNPLIEQLKQRLRGLPLAASAVPEATRAESASGERTTPPVAQLISEQTAEVYSFLAPARGAGEIGWLGGYRIVKILGGGGMGVVFDAEDVRLKRRVALKVMQPNLAANPAARQRFVREAQAAAALEHDHIVAIHQVGEERGVPFMTMPLLQGESLSDHVKREGKLPVAEVVRMGREIAEGLAAAHTAGLVHRDVKPANLWLEKTGRVKILDFGLARLASDHIHLTQTGAIIGTPAYMAPEQARGEAVDFRCDLFSLGCVLYHLATGRMPFRGRDTMSILLSLAQDQPPSPRELNPDVPPALADLILQLLTKDAAGRPSSARAVADALGAIRGEAIPPEAVPVAQPPRVRPPRRRLLLAAAAGGVLLVVVLAAQIILRITSKDGKVREVPINPGDKIEVVEPGAEVKKPDKSHPFVLKRAGGPGGAFAKLRDALAAVTKDEVIEIHGNGPFAVGKIQMRGRTVSLRAAPGYRPVLTADEEDLGQETTPWFALEKSTLLVEGCDIRCPFDRTAFRGDGPTWELRNCRLFGPARSRTLSNASVQLVDYSGPRLRVSDCLISQIGGCVLHVGPKCEVSVSNNIINLLATRFLELDSPGGQKLRLDHNTYLGEDALLLSFAFAKDAEAAKLDVSATLFHWTRGPLLASGKREGERKPLHDCLRWQGRDNAYSHASEYGYLTEPRIIDLAAWNRMWGQAEEGSREGGQAIFQWISASAGTAQSLRPVVEALRRQPGAKLGEFGPEWKLLGSGAGYVQALAAAGRPVPRERLRPAEEAGGPVVLLRADKVVRGYRQLPEAFEAAGDGDTIELRTDKTLEACRVASPAKGKRHLTLRGAPGYQPVVTGRLAVDLDNELIVENIHFYEGGIAGAAAKADKEARVPRVANCTMDGTYLQERLVATCRGTAGQPAEIVNCLIHPQGWPAKVQARVPAGEKLSVRNSVMDGCLAVAIVPETGFGEVVVDRCALWVPGGNCLWVDRGHPSFRVSGTLFEGSSALLVTWGGPASGWRGERNVYRAGRDSWLLPQEQPSAGLAAWRQLWRQPDEDSLEGEPLLYDPLTWQLRIESVGYRAGPGGRDVGADVQRVARTAKAE